MKTKKIFDIEKIGFGDELGEPVTANRMPKPLKKSPQPAPVAPVAKSEPATLFSKPLFSKKKQEPVPAPPKPKRTAPQAEAQYKAVEFISPISGSRGKKPSTLHLAHGQYLVDRQELIARNSLTEDYTQLTEDWKKEPADKQPVAAEKKEPSKKIFDLEAETVEAPSKIEEALPASNHEESIGYYELPPLSLLKHNSRLKNILSSPVAMLENDPLMVALGTDEWGGGVVGKLGRFGHHLSYTADAGLLHAQILGLLFKAGPRDLRLMLMDSQRDNFAVYEGLSHLASPILKGSARIAAGLEWAIAQCQYRFRLFSGTGVADIAAFNEARPTFDQELERLPYLVMVVDEWEDLKAFAQEVGALMADGPRAGIHLLAATASTSSFSGFQSQLHGAVWQFESRQKGLRLPLVGPEEIAAVVSHIGKQLTVDYLLDADLIESLPVAETPEEPLAPSEEETAFAAEVSVVEETPEELAVVSEEEVTPEEDFFVEEDALLEEEVPAETEVSLEEPQPAAYVSKLEAARAPIQNSELLTALELIIAKREASVSILQVHQRLSYSRAVRVLGELESRGWIQTVAGSATREITISEEEYLEITA